jgi:protease-4
MREFLLGMWIAIALVAAGPATRLMADDAAKDAKVEKKEDSKDSKSADAEKAAKEKSEAEAKEKKAREEKAAADKKAADEKKAAEEKKSADKSKAEEKSSKKDEKSDSNKSSDKKDAKSEKKVRFAHIVIDGELPESPGEMSLFGDLGVDLRKTMARLEKAGDDKSVAGVVLQINSMMGRGKLSELRSAVERVQSKGKKVYAVLESAIGPQYQLAAACDEIIMPESGEIMVPGVRAEFTFFKDLLGKLGIEADMMHVGDYKGAAEPFTRDSLSEPVRKNMTALVDDLYDEMLTRIASDRDLKTEDVRKAVDHGLLMAKEAKEAGLIDRIAYPDEFRKQLEKEYKTDNLVYVENYAKKKVDTDFSGPMGMMKLFQTILGEDSGKKSDSEAKVAVVYAVGPFTTG